MCELALKLCLLGFFILLETENVINVINGKTESNPERENRICFM